MYRFHCSKTQWYVCKKKEDIEKSAEFEWRESAELMIQRDLDKSDFLYKSAATWWRNLFIKTYWIYNNYFELIKLTNQKSYEETMFFENKTQKFPAANEKQWRQQWPNFLLKRRSENTHTHTGKEILDATKIPKLIHCLSIIICLRMFIFSRGNITINSK